MSKALDVLVKAIMQETLQTATYDAARVGALTYIEILFGTDSNQLGYAKSISDPARALQHRYNAQLQSEGMKQDLIGLAGALASMEGAYREVQEMKNPTLPARKFDQKKVFVVHGHDTDNLRRVQDFLKSLGLEPVVLQDQANRGRTLIEKFIEHSEVGFAIVLMTADDYGRSRSETSDALRARQNVILELGYFIGHLGRDRVAALYESGVETPSDISGLTYIPFGNAKWAEAVKLELQAIGMVS